MIQILKMAYRDLGRNRRRSFFSALALGMGLALLLMIAAVLQGEIRGALETSLKLQSGHLQLRAQSYEEDKSSLAWEDLIEDPAAVAAQIASLSAVQEATPRLFATGIVAVSDETIGVRIIGVDPLAAANAPYREGLVSGEFLTADDREGIVIGLALADKINAKPGDSLTLLINTSNGDVDQQPFVVRGIYNTRTPTYDQATVLMALAKAQAITRTENHASTIFVLLKDRYQADAVAAALQTNQYKVETWTEMNALMVEFENFAGAYMVVIYLIILGVTATVIVNTLIMSVFERTREIGILSAMGMRSGRIMALFFAESGMLAVGGILIGMILGGLLVAYLSRYGIFIGNMGISGVLIGERIYAYLLPRDAINLTITAFVVSLLAALYPAILAARMEPVQALHSGK